MSPVPLHPKTEETTTTTKAQSHLKINRESHSIKKSSAASASNKTQQRQPVIIYTHSPRIIHTNPRDFMALVQKLTGLSRSQQPHEENTGGGSGNGCKPPQPKREPAAAAVVADEVMEYPKNVMAAYCKEKEENETTSSIIRDQESKNNNNNKCMSMVETQCLGPLMEHQDPMMIPNNNNNNYVMRRSMPPPVFGSPSEFLCSNNALLPYAGDPLFF